MKRRGSFALVLVITFLWMTGFTNQDKVMAVQYAGAYTDIYQSDSTDATKIGVLYPLQEVAVLGSGSNNMYKVAVSGTVGYVSGANLLSYETARTILLQVTNQSYSLPYTTYVDRTQSSEVIFVGDSRTVQMLEATQDTQCSWIGESMRGYEWFVNIGIPLIDATAGEGSKIVVQVGINDLSRAAEYAQILNQKAVEWASQGAQLYVVSVNPLDFHQTISDPMIVQFNAVMQHSLLPEILYFNTYQFLVDNGYHTVDGIHYNAETYQRIYHYMLYALYPEREDYKTLFQAGEAAWKQQWDSIKAAKEVQKQQAAEAGQIVTGD